MSFQLSLSKRPGAWTITFHTYESVVIHLNHFLPRKLQPGLKCTYCGIRRLYNETRAIV